mmetsp:Transcript_33405/g.93721  ORF Transcript_33405/g.93721 Transcript_33405/m.93721 type:complete len:207 (+) Transcript_33405:68-688(+)
MIRERTARGSQVPREEVRWRAFRLGDGASLGGPAAVVAVPAEDTLVHGELAELEAVYLSQVLDVVDAKPREVLGDEAVVLAAALAAAFEDAPLRALHVDATGEAARVALLARRAVGQLDAVQASLCRRHELVVEEPVPHLVVDALGDDPELLCVAEVIRSDVLADRRGGHARDHHLSVLGPRLVGGELRQEFRRQLRVRHRSRRPH